jgi:hypothetical protein
VFFGPQAKKVWETLAFAVSLLPGLTLP